MAPCAPGTELGAGPGVAFRTSALISVVPFLHAQVSLAHKAVWRADQEAWKPDTGVRLRAWALLKSWLPGWAFDRYPSTRCRCSLRRLRGAGAGVAPACPFDITRLSLAGGRSLGRAV